MSTANSLQDLVIAQSPYGVVVPVADIIRELLVVGGTTYTATDAIILGNPGWISLLDVTLLDDGGLIYMGSGQSSLLGVHAPKLAVIGAGCIFDFSACVNLATVSLPRLATIGAASELNLNDNNWTEAQVNAQLVALDTTLGAGTGIINIGGTNAPPAGTGSTAKTSLEGKGYTVNV